MIISLLLFCCKFYGRKKRQEYTTKMECGNCSVGNKSEIGGKLKSSTENICSNKVYTYLIWNRNWNRKRCKKQQLQTMCTRWRGRVSEQAIRIWFYATSDENGRGKVARRFPSVLKRDASVLWDMFFLYSCSSFLPSWPTAHALTNKRDEHFSSYYLFGITKRHRNGTEHSRTTRSTAKSNWVEQNYPHLPLLRLTAHVLCACVYTFIFGLCVIS